MFRKLFPVVMVTLIVMALSVVSAALADPEDPTQNWCYAGMPWGDGRCGGNGDAVLSEWYWTCGYYRAQASKGTYPLMSIPETCRFIPPPPPAVSTPVVTEEPTETPTGEPTVTPEPTPVVPTFNATVAQCDAQASQTWYRLVVDYGTQIDPQYVARITFNGEDHWAPDEILSTSWGSITWPPMPTEFILFTARQLTASGTMNLYTGDGIHIGTATITETACFDTTAAGA